MINLVSDKPHYENVPFEIPESWEWVTLGEIGKWQAGGTPNRGHKEYYGGNIPWLKTGDLNDGYITHIPEHITQLGYENSSAKLNPKDSVLIALYGATIGKVGILTFPATTNQACCACIEYTAVDRLYLFYFLRQNRDNFISMGSGGAQPNISKEIITATPIPLPPINEQKRIVTAIEKWFALIDELEANKEDLKEYIKQVKSKVLDLAIHGKLVPQDPNDEPAIELLKRINPNFQPCDTSHYENLPQGWCTCSFKDAFDITMGSSPEGSTLNHENDGIEFHQGKINFTEKYLAPSNIYTNSPNKFGEAFSILLCVRAPVGIVNITQRKICIGRGLCTLLPKKDIDLMFAFYAMQTYQDIFEAKATGTTFKAISGSTIRDEMFLLPPYTEQIRIRKKLDELWSIIDSIRAEL